MPEYTPNVRLYIDGLETSLTYEVEDLSLFYASLQDDNPFLIINTKTTRNFINKSKIQALSVRREVPKAETDAQP